MKKVLFIIFCLSLSIEIGKTANKEPEKTEVVCPHPHLVSYYLQQLGGNFHAFLKNYTKTEIEHVSMHKMHIEVHPHMNPQGNLICEYYNASAHSSSPLITIHMGKNINLDPIQRPPSELEIQKK